MRVSNKGLYPKRKPLIFRGGHYLYLQFDFISSLEYTIVNECNYKVIYGEIMVEYLSIKQTSEKWGITVRRIQVLYTEGRIPGATKIGSYWAIPTDAENQTIKELRLVNI